MSLAGTAAGILELEPEPRIDRLLTRICETAAPTFQEERRALLVEELLGELGLEPWRDAVGNVIARVPGGAGPRVVIAAHLDTVFDASTDVTVRRDGTRWQAPGIGDNSASLAVLLDLLASQLQGDGALPRLTVAATVGEEGLGDLRGARAVLESLGGECDLFIALDGHLGTIVDRAVGSRRFEVRLAAQGGHSWGDFPSPSAVHALGSMVHSLQGMDVPRQPRSSYNVGQVWGGSGINAIAQEAGFNLDLRSVAEDSLVTLEREALGRIRRIARRHRVEASIRQVGERPASSGQANRALVATAREALEEVGVESRTTASSTDANVAMAAGIPAISFGVYRGGDAHRLSEWLERPSLEIGSRALTALLRRLTRIESTEG